jgi:hypothetical protein
MPIDLSWRDIAALWGAVLSTLIFLGKFLPAVRAFTLNKATRPPQTSHLKS